MKNVLCVWMTRHLAAFFSSTKRTPVLNCTHFVGIRRDQYIHVRTPWKGVCTCYLPTHSERRFFRNLKGKRTASNPNNEQYSVRCIPECTVLSQSHIRLVCMRQYFPYVNVNWKSDNFQIFRKLRTVSTVVL